jgi:RNA 2',3'-cyclic 3'-phosphodiesterase
VRCFIAIRPPADTADQLERLVQALAAAIPHARPVTIANLHLTLAFIGALTRADARRVSDAMRSLDDAAFPASTWVLDRIGTFVRARVVWIGGAPNATLHVYVDTVTSMLRRLALPFDSRSFVAHVTLLRKVRPDFVVPPLQLPVHWPLTRPQVMHSLSGPGGVRYELVS